MFPRVMVSSTNPAYSLTVYNASSSHYTLTVMSIIALIFVPIVLAYQGWTYYMFRKRITRRQTNTGLLDFPAGVNSFIRLFAPVLFFLCIKKKEPSMAKVVVIGAGFAGHTAALYLGSKLGKKHQVTVISKRDIFSYLPSWVWVGVNHMKPEKTVFKLEPVYEHKHIKFVHAAAKEIHPDTGEQYVVGEEIGTGNEVRLDYDYLVIAPGPVLNFAGTPGLGPEGGLTDSICSLPHAS